jgi:hypothetical protein
LTVLITFRVIIIRDNILSIKEFKNLNDSEADFKLSCNLYCHGNGTKLQV